MRAGWIGRGLRFDLASDGAEEGGWRRWRIPVAALVEEWVACAASPVSRLVSAVVTVPRIRGLGLSGATSLPNVEEMG
jgi:hypothetical protein